MKKKKTYLLVDDSAESGLALDDGIGDTHLAAEGGEEDDELNGVDIVGDEDKRSLLVLNEADDVVETVLDGVGLLRDVLLLLALFDGSGLLEETLLLLDLGLRAVLVEELESLGSGVLVEHLLELGDRRGDLQAEVEDLLLALETDVLGPLDHAREVALGLDVLADTEVARTLLKERVLTACQRVQHVAIDQEDGTNLGGLLASLSLGEGGGGGSLSRLGRLSLRRRHQLMFDIDWWSSRTLKSGRARGVPSQTPRSSSSHIITCGLATNRRKYPCDSINRAQN